MSSNLHQAIQTLIVSSRQEEAERLADAVRRGRDLHYLGQVDKAAEAIAAVSQLTPDVIVIDDPVFGATTPGLVQELLHVHPDAVVVVVAAADALTTVQQALLAGARGFLLRPVDANELVATIHRLYDLGRTRSAGGVLAEGVPQLKRGQIIAVAGLKGGVGRTTIATNLALALQQQIQSLGQQLVLVDAHLEKGDCAAHLNLQPSFTLYELLNRFNELDYEMLKSVLTSHSSGLKLLAAPPASNALIQMPAYQMEAILTSLQDMVDYVVVDIGSTLSEVNLAILDMADTILAVTMPEFPTLLHTKVLLDLAEERRYAPDKVKVILNRADMRGGISAEDIEKSLRIKLAAELPDDVGLVLYSINQGVPVMLSAERSDVARGIARLASEFTVEGGGGPRRGRRLGLLSVFDRLSSASLKKESAGQQPSLAANLGAA